jgi:branched-chain amino acid transport system substrate-binding protein
MATVGWCTDVRRRHWVAAAATSLLPSVSRAAAGDIVVGQIGPFTGMPAHDAPELNQGIHAAFTQINAVGGVNGRKLTLFELDDGYQDDAFVRQFTEALKRKPVALLAPVGTRSIQKMLDDKLLDTADVIVLNAIPGADSLRKPGHPKLFHIRAGDRQQVERVVRHAVTLGITQMAVLYQDVPIGKSGLSAAQKVVEELQKSASLRLTAFSANAGAVKIASAARRAADSAPQSVLVLGSPKFTADGIAALRQASFTKSIYALSYVPPALIHKLAEDGSRGVALAQVFPNPNGNTSALQHAFHGAMNRAGIKPPFTAFQLEGYVTARVLTEGLRHAKELSAAGLARALRAMGDVSLGGFRVNFSKDNVGSGFVDIAVMNRDGRLTY